MKLALLGLGNMGLNMALNLKDKGHEVVGWNRSPEKRENARSQGIRVMDTLQGVVAALDGEERKVLWMMISAGEPIDSLLFDEGMLFDMLDSGGVIIDGANSHYADSKRRAEKLLSKEIKYIDCGVSGGVTGARNGACLMAGGDEEAFRYIEPVLKDLSAEGGYGYFGASGVGHFVKMVHNGIEYGMMQSLAEGANIISSSDFQVDLNKLTSVWNSGSIIQGNLMGYLNQALQKDGNLRYVDSEIGSLGTGRWTVEEALKLGVPVNAIASAVFARHQSRDKDSMIYRAVQAMREVFGGNSSKDRAK